MLKTGRIDLQVVPLLRRLAENLGPEARAGRVQRIATRHAESDRLVAGNLIHQIDAAVVGALGLRKISALQQRAGMVDRMAFDAEPFLEPRLQLRIGWIDLASHDADRRPAVDLFQPLEDRPEIGFVLRRIPHIVDRQHDDCFDPFFTHPLRRRQFRKVATDVIRIAELGEVRQSIAIRRECRLESDDERNNAE